MLTRAREAQARASPDTVLSPLPRCFVRAVFVLLPADQRLRCVEVSRAWRALLADTSLWKSLNLSNKSGINRFSEALFRAAVAKAGGQLHELDVNWRPEALSFPTLVDALASNAATLELLDARSRTWFAPAEVDSLLEAAPLSMLHVYADPRNDVEQARRYLRNEPPYERLRLRGLNVNGDGQLDSLGNLQAFCIDLLKHPSLKRLYIVDASLGTAAAMRVLVNASIALRVHVFGLVNCGCTHACVPEWTRFVSAVVLECMVIHNDDVELFEAGADTDKFCDAIRASAWLYSLQVDHCGPNPDVAAVAAFINARRQRAVFA